MIAAAERGAEQLQVEPSLPLYMPGEQIELHVRWQSTQTSPNLRVRIKVMTEDSTDKPVVQTESLSNELTARLPAPTSKGLHKVDAELLDESGARIAIAHSGFWIRDEAYLLSGPKLTVNHDYFEVNGKPLLVVGTTYMSSDVQRLYYEFPNVSVWDRDLGEIAGAGINTLRTGWWSGWDKLCDPKGMPSERT